MAGSDIPERTRVLSLENSDDLVWALDGRDNPASPHHATVRFEDASLVGNSPMVSAGTDPHDTSRYANAADDLERAGQRNVVEASQEIARMMGYGEHGEPGQQVQSTCLDYAFTRQEEQVRTD